MMTLEEVVEELAPRLLRYCRGSCDDAGMAEEAAQDGLAALVQRWRRHGPPESPEAFAFTVARRRLRRGIFRRRLLAPMELVMDRSDSAPNPEVTAGDRVEVGQVLMALNSLPEIERVEPIFQSYPGWNSDTSKVKNKEDLPENAKRYLAAIESLTETPVEILSVGKRRDETIMINP